MGKTEESKEPGRWQDSGPVPIFKRLVLSPPRPVPNGFGLGRPGQSRPLSAIETKSSSATMM